ncbi:MAG: DUF2889 domain-containing protein [Actinobacteria bacterium]|nr:DUF2889 domain-containing protein [Actinomycetota bacterium]
MMDLFNRSIEIAVAEEGENIRISGTLLDRRLVEDLHGIEAEMLVSFLDGEILEIRADMPTFPMEECKEGLQSVGELRGHQIIPGFTDMVKNTVGSDRGCTHLASLVMNMANVSVQGRGAYIRKRFPDEAMRMYAMEQTTVQMGLLDSCVCWTEDGPIISRWRQQKQDMEKE